MNDKWNPRLWLRDWLNRRSKAELAELKRRAQVVAEALAREVSARAKS